MKIKQKYIKIEKKLPHKITAYNSIIKLLLVILYYNKTTIYRA